MPQKVFRRGSSLAIIIPKALARHYQIEAGTVVETVPTSEGLLVRPIEIVPGLPREWEQSLDWAVARYRPALDKLGE